MASITFISHDGRSRTVAATEGVSVMRAARDADIPEILADCGGACACATCHVYIDPAWFAATGPISEDEEAMLDIAVDRRDTSRLTCQITVTEALDGLTVTMPKSQY